MVSGKVRTSVLQDTIKRMKSRATFASHIFDLKKRLAYRIYEEQTAKLNIGKNILQILQKEDMEIADKHMIKLVNIIIYWETTN